MEKLLDALREVVGGASMDADFVRSIGFSHDDPKIMSMANDAWIRLRAFAVDFDIRGRDPAYDRQMRDEVAWRLEDLLCRMRSQS